MATEGETAVEHLTRLANLSTEVGKDTNTLTIDWANSRPETTGCTTTSHRATIVHDVPYGRGNVPALVTITLNYLP